MSDLVVPALGESISEAIISKWLKKVGEAVAQDEPVVDLETDKVSVQLPAPAKGVLTEQLFAEGTTVKVGQAIGRISESAAAQTAAPLAPAPAPANPPAAIPTTVQATGSASVSPSPTTAAAPPMAGVVASRERDQNLPATAIATSAQISTPAAPELSSVDGGHGLPHVLSPARRRALREQEGHAVAATTVQTPPIPLAASAAATLPAFPGPTPAPSPPGVAPAVAAARQDEEVVAMSPLRKRIAERLVAAQHTAAILTTFNEVDMTNLLGLRARHQDAFVARHGIKLGFMSFFTKAVVAALIDFPMLNAEIRGTDMVFKKRYDIGIAVGSGRGLVVPVLRNADRLGFAEIEKGIAALAGKAKDNKLTIEELSNGTFTITNGGIYGSMMSTPLLNLPQTGILGMHNIIKRPIAVGDEIKLRPMMYIALSYDHRLVDGREAVQFLVSVKDRVENPERLLFSI